MSSWLMIGWPRSIWVKDMSTYHFIFKHIVLKMNFTKITISNPILGTARLAGGVIISFLSFFVRQSQNRKTLIIGIHWLFQNINSEYVSSKIFTRHIEGGRTRSPKMSLKSGYLIIVHSTWFCRFCITSFNFWDRSTKPGNYWNHISFYNSHNLLSFWFYTFYRIEIVIGPISWFSGPFKPSGDQKRVRYLFLTNVFITFNHYQKTFHLSYFTSL